MECPSAGVESEYVRFNTTVRTALEYNELVRDNASTQVVPFPRGHLSLLKSEKLELKLPD